VGVDDQPLIGIRRISVKLYYSPGACSLADHIALHEAGLAFEHERVDLRSKKTEHDGDYAAINPKGYVPALTIDSGETLTENVAILYWIAEQAPHLRPAGHMGCTHLVEALGYIGSEIHKGFKPLMSGADDVARQQAKGVIAARLRYLSDTMVGDYLFGPELSVADCYLFVMLLWARRFEIEVPDYLGEFQERMMGREAVRKAMAHEGLL
jgi:glutathione S-transferase